MAWIVQQFASDNGVQLGMEDMARPMPGRTNWTWVRFGWRLACKGVATIPYTTFPPYPRVGICTGPQAFVSSTTTDALYWANVSGGNWNAVYAGTPPYTYFQPNGASVNIGLWQKLNGTTNYWTGAYSGVWMMWSSNPTAFRTVLIFDYIKAAGTQVTCYIRSQTTSQLFDIPRSSYLLMMENDTPPNLSVGGITATLSRTVRDWDHAYVGWSRAVPSCTFYDMTVVRFL